MHETGKDSNQGKLGELTGRIHDYANNLNKSCSELEVITDKLYGSIPEACTEKGEDQPVEGKMGQLEQAITVMGRQCNSVINAVDRLTDYGIV